MSAWLYAASRKGLFRYRRDGATWQALPVAFVGAPVSSVLRDPRDGRLYVALHHGHFGTKLHRSDDDGDTWTELPSPAFPPAAEADAKAPSVEMIWTLEAGGADEPGVLWAGTLPGGLFRLTEYGAKAQLVDALWDRPERQRWSGGGYDSPGIHSVLVDPRDARAITVGVSCGGVWKSADGGQSWALHGQGLRADYMPPDLAYDPEAQDPHRLAACATVPDSVWCQHHNGIFRSDDGGRTFVDIRPVAPSDFGFAVVVHPHKPHTAWFVPAVKDECRVPVNAQLVVTRTDDGGKTFRSLTTGLPEAPSYDLVYRHGLAIDDSGDGLAMGSTTGNLWVSDDGGEHWAPLSQTLPPIYQVAFG
jgi:photosystem II stability/assembly factor-like uncharacterized protein